MKRLVTASGAVLAVALLILASKLEPTGPTFSSDYGGAAMVAPVLLIASELRP